MEVTNRTPEASCLIFKWDTDKSGKTGTVEMWSDRDIKPGVIVKANQALYFAVEGTKEYFPFRVWEVKDVLSVRDFKGNWDKKNEKSYYTVTVIPKDR